MDYMISSYCVGGLEFDWKSRFWSMVLQWYGQRLGNLESWFSLIYSGEFKHFKLIQKYCCHSGVREEQNPQTVNISPFLLLPVTFSELLSDCRFTQAAAMSFLSLALERCRAEGEDTRQVHEWGNPMKGVSRDTENGWLAASQPSKERYWDT